VQAQIGAPLLMSNERSINLIAALKAVNPGWCHLIKPLSVSDAVIRSQRSRHDTGVWWVDAVSLVYSVNHGVRLLTFGCFEIKESFYISSWNYVKGAIWQSDELKFSL